MPLPIIIPPNIIEHNTRYMVESIPSTPPVDTSELSISLPVSILVSVKSTPMATEISDDKLLPPPRAVTTCGWNTNMPASPNNVLRASVNTVLSLNRMRTHVISGMSSTHGVMLNEACRCSVISMEWDKTAVGVSCPTMK